MRKFLVSLVALPLVACGGDLTGSDFGGGDTTALSDEEKKQARDARPGINFGDDTGDWANDGECDDPRFRGPGMTTTPLLEEDTERDATDCRNAYDQGKLILRD